MITASQIIIRLLIAVLLSGLLGLEREFKHRPAGLRTNILVGLGSCLIVLLSLGVTRFGVDDPTRIASGVITGIGFLGAGLIIHDQHEVQGITTAAAIWVVSAIGMAVGFGLYFLAIAGTLITLLVLYFFNSERLKTIFKN